jgi:hypothetical protein
MKRTLLAVALSVAASGASAAPFYLDLGASYGSAVDGVCGANCTGLKDEFLFTYESASTIYDTDASGSISTGDQIVSNAGMVVGPLSENKITGFAPDETFGTESNNGLGSAWEITFSITNWVGTVAVDSSGAIAPTYGNGLLEFYITFDGVSFNNFMDVQLETGSVNGTGTAATGVIDFTNVDSSIYNNLFHSGTASCAGSDGFYDMWLNCGAGSLDEMDIAFLTNFDSNVFYETSFGVNPGTSPLEFTIATDHDGSATFAVPEPGTLSLLGLSLLGMGSLRMRRRKSA